MNRFVWALPGLAAVRHKKMLTQEELAKRAGMARSSVAEIETLVRPARVSTVRKLAEALGVSPELLKREPKKRG